MFNTYFFTRNADIEVKIIYATKYLSDKDNFLLVRSTDCVFYRNQYETSSTYGSIKHIIRSIKFLKAMKALVKPNEEWGKSRNLKA